MKKSGERKSRIQWGEKTWKESAFLYIFRASLSSKLMFNSHTYHMANTVFLINQKKATIYQILHLSRYVLLFIDCFLSTLYLDKFHDSILTI